MPRLIVYVPFARGPHPPEGDLRSNAEELANAPLDGFTIGGLAIDAVVAVFLGEEAAQVARGDVLCVHAHGGPGRFTSVTDNLGETTTLDNVLDNLDALGAANAAACYFFVCYSAENNHVAATWKARHPAQPVFGSDAVAEGGIIRTTRTKIRSSIFDPGNRQLRQL